MDAFYLVLDGKIDGPHSMAQITEMLARGDALRETLAWYEGSAEWVPLGYLLDRIDEDAVMNSRSGGSAH
jgi:hypothetical protein